MVMRRHLRSQETQREAARAFSRASDGVERHQRQPSQKHDQSSILRTTTHSGVMVVTGAPRGTLLVRFGALFVFRASARARDESTCLALACERTTTISVVAIGDPESPGLRLPGKPTPHQKDHFLGARECGNLGLSRVDDGSWWMMGWPFLHQPQNGPGRLFDATASGVVGLAVGGSGVEMRCGALPSLSAVVVLSQTLPPNDHERARMVTSPCCVCFARTGCAP